MSASAATTVVNAAQKAQNFANQTVETARIEVLKEPLGFIKILQFFMALLAFATAVSGSSKVEFKHKCNSTSTYVTYRGEFNYPYDLQNAPLKPVSAPCIQGEADRNTITNESNNIMSSAQFFVFTGVTAFLYSIAFTIIYVFFRHKYQNIVFFPLIDFAATCLFTLFWFAGSIAWSKAAGDIQSYTNPENLIDSMSKLCPIKIDPRLCQGVYNPNYANIIVSCILGFGNLILWGGDVWFVLKETSWYKTRMEIRQQSQNTTNNPISPNDINFTAHYNPNGKI